jgi:exopolysaccharide production protein ExoQ
MAKGVTIAKKKVRENWLQAFEFVLAALILYTGISRLFSWDVFTVVLNYRIPLLLERLGFSASGFHLDIFWLNAWIVRLVILFAGLFLVFAQGKYLRRGSFWLSCLPLLALLALTGLSRYWSVASGYTDARFQLLLATGMGGILIGLAWKERRIRLVLEIFAVLVVLGSLAVVLIDPAKFTFFDFRGQVGWYGLFSWKMPFGMMMGFAVVLFLFRLLDFKQEKWLPRVYGVIFYALAWFMLYMSQSMTEVLAVVGVHLVVILGFLYLKWGHHLKPIHWGVLAGLVLAAVVGAWIGRGFLMGLVGRDATLTGRLKLWSDLVPIIQDRLLLGYGFGEAFWKNPAYYLPILESNFWHPVFAHSGYIEALMDNGILGLGLWIVFLLQTAFLTLRHFVRRQNLSALFYFAWVVFIAVMNVANNHLGSYETFTWLLLVISFACMLREAIDLKAKTTAAVENAN